MDNKSCQNKYCIILNTVLISALLMTMVTIVYWKVGYYPFVNFDDDVYIADNLMVLNGLTWDGITWAFGAIYPNWHPLTWVSHMADVELFGLNAGLHHLENVLLHVLTTLILFLALSRVTRVVHFEFVGNPIPIIVNGTDNLPNFPLEI